VWSGGSYYLAVFDFSLKFLLKKGEKIMAFTGNTRNLSQQQVVHDGNPDGILWSNTPRSNPMQVSIGSLPVPSMITYSANDGTLSATAANTCGAQAITVTGLLTTDFIVAIHKPTDQAGLSMGMGMYANAANSLNVNLANPTASSNTATANQAINVAVLRGMPGITTQATVTLPAFTTAVNAPGMQETVFTLGATAQIGTFACTPIVSGGQVTGYNVTPGGYFEAPPTVNVAPSNSDYAGYGATAVAVLSTTGTVVAILPMDFGSGYTSGGVSVTLSGGIQITPGMIAQVNVSTQVANLAIGNVRVVGKNQIAVTSFSTGTGTVTPTAANFTFLAAHQIPAESMQGTVFFTAAANFANVAANVLTAFAVPTPGILVTDLCFPVIPAGGAAPLANLLVGPSTANANDSITIGFAGAGVSAVTTAAGVYNIPVQRQSMTPPMVGPYDVYLTPAACAANTATEQIFTLPTGITLQTLTPVLVNMQGYTQGVTINTNARANSTGTIGIKFINNTSRAITPAPCIFRIANFPALIPTLSANITQSGYIQMMGVNNAQQNGLLNELQQTMLLYSMFEGA
jgi:hypothetical protein